MRLEAAAGGRGAMMATSPTAVGGLTVAGLPVRKSEDIADLIELFSKMQYRAKEVTPRVRREVPSLWSLFRANLIVLS